MHVSLQEYQHAFVSVMSWALRVNVSFAGSRNSINGRLYKEDPTIFAWDLINEPRCDCFPDTIPAPPELISCRPECAQKLQVSTSAT